MSAIVMNHDKSNPHFYFHEVAITFKAHTMPKIHSK